MSRFLRPGSGDPDRDEQAALTDDDRGGSGDPGADPAGDVRLGDLLREARLSRSLTLADVERDTRINRDYLDALENERYEVLPAPVYARGFLRSYARHLGLDVEETISLLPADLPRPPGLEPLPGLRRAPRTGLPAINASLVAIVLAIVVVLAMVAFAFTSLGGADGTASVDPAPATPSPAPASPTTASGGPTTPQPTVPPFDVGQAPNFIGVSRDTAQTLLTQLGLQFVVIEVASAEAPAGEVFGQSPDPGAPIEAGDNVTLVVSGGPPR